MSESRGYIKQNPASYLLAFVTVVFLIFTTTFGGALFAPAVIMYLLIFSSLVLNAKFVKNEDQPEPSNQEFLKIGLLGIFGLITFLILNIFVPELKFGTGTVTVNVFTGTIPNLTLGTIWSTPFTAAFIFGTFLVPIAEENFFRVLIGNIALRYLPFFVVIPVIGAIPVIAVVMVGTVFSTFHFAAYGLNWTNLMILWGAGSALYAFDLQAGNPLPSMLSHILNNALAFLLGGNILLQLVPSLGQFSGVIMPLFQVGLISFVAFRGLRLWIRSSR